MASSDGGGIANNGTLELGSSIIASNNAPSGTDASGTITSLGWNVIGNTTGATLTGTTTGNLLNGAASPLNLGTLASDGRPAQTMALGAGSVAIGHGNCASLSGVPAVTTNQRGVSRKSPCDVGAYDPARLRPPR